MVIIRAERAPDREAIRSVTAAAFRGVERHAPSPEPGGDPGEAVLVGWLRPGLSLVAVEDGLVVGHVVATRAAVGGRPALGLGPLSVHPDRQGSGIGSALMHTVLGAAEARGEPLVGLLGEPAYYSRFGFAPAVSSGVISPDPSWGDYFQVRTLTAYDGHTGRFRYAEPFGRL
ncbi:GNAT family N-acetyltransferase [Citricoccus zhacaiensis]